MQIEIKKDIETAYKDEFFKGLSVMEVVAVGAAAATAITIVVVLWKCLGMPVEVGVYVSIPCILPILAMGFLKIQGLSPWQYLWAMIHTYQHPILTYEASELPSHPWHTVSMLSMQRKKKRGKKP